MKNYQAIAYIKQEDSYLGEKKKCEIISEPYPLISSDGMKMPRNYQTYVGVSSITCVSVLVDGEVKHDIPVRDLSEVRKKKRFFFF